MEKIIINGSRRLNGEIEVHGSKNSALPILAATVLANGKSVIHNCPRLSDVDAAIKILEHLGCKVEVSGHTVMVDSQNVNSFEIPDDLMREMRSSIVFLGAILGRMNRAVLSTPGGCEIGLRPIDLHLAAMKQFGADINEEYGKLDCTAENGLDGAKITLSFPSVGATENIMLAAATARGTTTLTNAAREPEISDLADFLNGCGAKIHGAGDSTIVIEGVKKLSGATHTVIADRIEASTYMIAAAMTGGKICIKEIIPAHIGALVPMLKEAGCDITISGRWLCISSPPRPKRIKTVRTMPYPGFPTDVQAPLMAMLTIADGTSVVIENIFESRYKAASELLRLGAKISVEGRMAVIEGVPCLMGASVVAPDLRGGIALVLAGLCARGETIVTNIEHIDRGYEAPEILLQSIGADIKRTKENDRETKEQVAAKKELTKSIFAPSSQQQGKAEF
ncbi:MAG: UDP-N-acetylglucosamine 1-carboxyvinyltransferase [Oscillospiraceae bacterium]